TRGRATPLEEYRSRFPLLFRSAERLRALTFEEFRLRRQAGQAAEPEDYRRRFGIDPAGWPALPERPPSTAPGRSGVVAPRRLLEGSRRSAGRLNGLPEVGDEFFGFQLIGELGRGSFGRVFLARQGELADRPVALKVAANLAGESRKLAQLQHTNIVPV